MDHINNDTKVDRNSYRCSYKFSSVDDAWLLSLVISVKKAKTGRYFDMNTITIGDLSQADRTLFSIEYSYNFPR